MKSRLMIDAELKLASEITSREQDQKALLRKWCQAVWEFIATRLTQKLEPQVWQARIRNGETYWRVHDPTTGRSTSMGSKEEVIAWIEQTYYQKTDSTGCSGFWLR